MQLVKALASLSAAIGVVGAAFVGSATYYNPGLGACGWIHGNNDFVVAIPASQFGNGQKCGRKIQANYGNGRYVFAQIVDKCNDCSTGIDLSPAAFNQLAPLTAGRISPVTWDYLPG